MKGNGKGIKGAVVRAQIAHVALPETILFGGFGIEPPPTSDQNVVLLHLRRFASASTALTANIRY